jgi:hypothetical protein
MNRKRRKKGLSEQQDWSLSLAVVHPNAPGIDIGNECQYVAVPPGGDPEPVRAVCLLYDRGSLSQPW